MQNEKSNSGEKINDFVQRNRKGIFTAVGLVLFLLAAFIVFLAVKEYTDKKAIAEVEKLSERYEEASGFLAHMQETTLDYEHEHDHGEDEEAVSALLDDLNKFAKNRRGFSGSRAWSLIAKIYSTRKEWPQAEEAWLNAAKTGAKTYLSPIAFFNAAAVAEEQGRLEQAIEYLQNSVSSNFEFPAAPRAQFSIGRLNEQLENYPAALEAYRTVLIKWPEIPVWQYLAHSRIAAIEIR